jgi:hypothetical protein
MYEHLAECHESAQSVNGCVDSSIEVLVLKNFKTPEHYEWLTMNGSAKRAATNHHHHTLYLDG